MSDIIGITLGLALVDSLNPATISTMAVLLPLVRRAEHALSFLFSTYLVYFAGGLALFYGLDRFLIGNLSQFTYQYRLWIYAGEILFGLILSGLGIWMWLKKARESRRQPADPATAAGIKSVHPSFLFLFGIVSTLSDLPTALPLIAFVGRMVEFQPSFLAFNLLLLVYVLVYVAPLIALYVIFRMAREKIQPFTRRFMHIIQFFNQYALAPLLVGLGIWAILDGFRLYMAG